MKPSQPQPPSHTTATTTAATANGMHNEMLTGGASCKCYFFDNLGELRPNDNISGKDGGRFTDVLRLRLKERRKRRSEGSSRRLDLSENNDEETEQLRASIKVDKTLHFVEKPVEIMDREVKTLKRSKIPIVKVRWSSRRGPEFTWEREDHMKARLVNLAYRDLEAAFECLVAIICYVLHVYVVAKFFAYFVGKILGGDQLLVILCGYDTKSLELGTSFLSMTVFVALDRGTRSVSIVILSFKNASIYACSDYLLLTPLCCDDIHDVMPRVSALAGCDRLVSEPLVIENYVSLIRKKFCWGTIFPIGLKRYKDPKKEPIKKEPLMELKEIGLCTHAKRQGRERDNRNAMWPGPTNGKEGRWRYVWWPCMENDIATYVSNCLTCLKSLCLAVSKPSSLVEKNHCMTLGRIHMELYIENQENRRMILNSVQNGLLVWPTVVEEDGTTRTKRYKELSVVKKLQADCDLKATNIVLQGHPPDVYAIVNHPKVAKEIWDRVKLLMQGTKLSLQEKECKLYDEFDKFSFVKGEPLY
ncbi:retrovirus-related pol polyprotein from transposon TNT 1-94 [Tanacetum coccineum]